MTNKIAEIEKIYIIPEFVKLNPEKYQDELTEIYNKIIAHCKNKDLSDSSKKMVIEGFIGLLKEKE